SALVDSLQIRPAFDLGIYRRLIRISDSSECLQFSRAGFSIEALHIALFANFHRSIDIDFHKIRSPASDFISSVPIRRDQGDDCDDTVTGQQPGDESDSSDIFIAIGFAEPEILTQMLAHGIAIQHLGSIPEIAQSVQEFFAKGGFARGTQTCQPDDDNSPPGTAKLVRRTASL